MTKQEIHEQIVRLTSELHATNVDEKIFKVAQEGDSKKVEEIFEAFKKENINLYARIVSFGEAYNALTDESTLLGEIFAVRENKAKGKFIYDTKIINTLSFFLLLCFADIDDFYLFDLKFEAKKNFVSFFKEAGYQEMHDFVCKGNWKDWVGEDEDSEYHTWCELLVAIFKGEFSS